MAAPRACFFALIAVCVIGIVVGSICDYDINVALHGCVYTAVRLLTMTFLVSLLGLVPHGHGQLPRDKRAMLDAIWEMRVRMGSPLGERPLWAVEGGILNREAT